MLEPAVGGGARVPAGFQDLGMEAVSQVSAPPGPREGEGAFCGRGLVWGGILFGEGAARGGRFPPLEGAERLHPRPRWGGGGAGWRRARGE